MTFNVKTTTEVGSGAIARPGIKVESLRAVTAIGILAVKDVPAFIPEPNIDCEDNYIQSLEFELSRIQFSNTMRKDYTQSWESVNKKMIEDQDFGELLKNTAFIKDTVTALCGNSSTDIEKAVRIYNYVQKNMKWDGSYHIWATKGLKKPYSERTGTSSEINLLLTLMFQTAGIKSYPVLFSTRNNGIAITFYPTISKFNSVLSSVDIDGKLYLVDATSKYCPFGVLPAVDINGKGRLVNKYAGDWIDLNPNDEYKAEKCYNLNISSEGILTGSITGNYSGYSGVLYRNSINNEKSTDDYSRKLQENLKGLTINRYAIAEKNNIYKPLCDTMDVEISDNVELIGDKLLFNPLLYEAIEKNRYTLEERKYPVDYNYPISELYTFNYTIPKGYKIESLPESITIGLPDKSIEVSYSAEMIDNKIKIQYARKIKKILFLPDEYQMLKSLYDQLVKKHTEMVILKKSV